MTEDLEKMLKIAEKSAEQVQLTLDTGMDYSISSKKSETQKNKSDIYIENAETSKYTLRLVKDGKHGGFSFYNPSELETAIKKALKAAEFAEYLNIVFPENKQITNIGTYS